jgi:hypothetical protein
MKTRPRRVLPVLLLITPLLLVAGCSDHGMASAGDETVLLSVSPAAGATSVDPTASVSVQFSHPIMPGMEEYALLHLGDVTGPVVDGTWSLGEGGTVLRFVPDQQLENGTTYTVHLGGGMRDGSGHPVDFYRNGSHMGGRWATSGMMGGGGHHGGGHMGGGWTHASGTHGMMFSFTTAP